MTNVGYDRSEGTFDMARDFGDALANDMLHNYDRSDTANISIRTLTKKVSGKGQYTFISILDLGDIQIAMLPGEPMESIGVEIKDSLPGPYNIVMGLTDDYIGYIIPDDEWGTCSNSFKPECYEETQGGGSDVYRLLKESFRSAAKEFY